MQLNIFKKDFWKGQRLLLLAFLVLHTIASFYYILQHNVTFDEPDYIEYAKRWLHGRPERIQPLDDSKSPVVAIAWIPRIVRQTINPNYQLNDYGRRDQKEGRFMMVLFSFLTAIYVYKWCNDLYGERGWILPLPLLLFDPLYLAYTTIITTDLACGAFLIALLYHYRKYLVFQSAKHFYAAALYTALGVITKQSLLFVLLLLPLLSIMYKVTETRSIKSLVSMQTLQRTAIFLLIIVLGINLVYYFHGSFIPFGKYSFESNALRTIQNQFSFLHWLPTPFPYSYVQSIDMLKAHADIGAGRPESTFNGVYLFGNLRSKGGYWYYYLVLLFYKMPVGSMLLFLSSIPLFISKFNLRSFVRQYMFLLVPVLFYWIILSFFNQFQNGIRHLLLVFPLLFVGLGYLFKQLANASTKYKVLAGAAICYTFVTVAIYYPYIIPYTNEFITEKKTVFRKVYDSSVDYGQSDSSASHFISLHPEYKNPSPVPDTGKFAIAMGQVLNTYLRESNVYNWYQKLEPKDHYHYTILLYDIKEGDLKRAGLIKGAVNNELRIMNIE